MPELPEPTVPPKPAAGPNSAWRRPAALIAVIALALLGWQWLETRQRLANVQEELAKRLADSDAVAKESRVVARQTQEAQAALQAKIGALEAKLAETQGQQLALDAVYQDLSKSGDERLLSEVEQSVTIAAQQLRLAGNVEAALIALTGAEARLARAARPQFLGLRKLVARDIERLKALPSADVPGLAMKLEGIIVVVDTLPLAYERRPTVEPAKAAASPAEMSFWRSLMADFWAEVRQLVRIERIDAPGHADPALLSPSQGFFLRENLKLRLVDARLALLARDGRSFREDVRQSAEWLERYFDGSAKNVVGSLATLKKLQAVDVGIEVPGLNETLDALRNFKLAKEKK
ncbi:MAG TPA: uroporphyrinogen-III C-methyltransferase [Rhodocyclaceae bacterium]|nr:uroporphyrinogen-III C-methyltransferase [Rhodocyclaceae bacterium]